jgi:O-antigen ligase
MRREPGSVLKGQVTTSYPARATNTAPVGFQSAVSASGSGILQGFAVLLIVIHMARPFDVVLTGFHIPMIVCGLSVLAAFACNGLSGVNSPVGRILAAFVVWSLLVSPFSMYRRGSAVYEWGYFALDFVLVLVVAGAPSTLKQLTNLISVLAISTTLSIIWFSRGGGAADGVRVSGVGEWGNAGDFALTAGFLLPFCVLAAMLIKNKGVKYVVLTAWTLFLLRTTVATATRSALIGFACVAIVLLLRVSMMKRVGIVIAGVVAATVVVATIPGEALDRLGTMSAAIGLTDASPAETGEAMGSATERKELQMDALKAIGDNPLVGVGPGQFPNYRYTYFLDAAGRHKRWFPAHNTYLQVAAECGVIGGVLYFLFIGSIFLTINRVRRLSLPGSHPQWQLVNRIALCLELSLIFFAVCAAFLNCQTYAHQFIVAGMAIALERLTKLELTRASQNNIAASRTFKAPTLFRPGAHPRKAVALPSIRANN